MAARANSTPSARSARMVTGCFCQPAARRSGVRWSRAISPPGRHNRGAGGALGDIPRPVAVLASAANLWGASMFRVLWLLVLVVIATPAAAQEYQSKELADAAAQYRQELIDGIPAAKKDPALVPRLRRDADAEYRAHRYPQAIDDLRRAIAFGADDGLVWLRLAQALAEIQDDHFPASAYNAYRKSSDPVERGIALFLIGRDLDRHDKPKEALAAFEAGLALTRSANVAERVEQLHRLVAFRVTKVEITAEADTPRACLRFNEKIATGADISYGDFVRAKPDLAGIVTARGDTLCLDGLKHGETYEVELRLVRINERNLVPSINGDKLTMSFDPESVEELISQSGSLVWQGEMTITGERNRPVVTAIPLAPLLRDKGPGVYLAVVERADAKPGEPSQPSTNWVLVSNLGLSTYTGSDGMEVAVRSLADAKPIAGVTLRLYARNNGELAAVTSDADGLARIAGGLLHGSGGDEPFAVIANGPGGDFNFLEV